MLHIIDTDLAKRIVDRTIDILGKNINIMNCNSIIIASSDKNRINTYHEGADLVIKKGRTVEISVEESERLKGTKPGVNIPLEFEHQLIGVLGITGPPNQVRNYGLLVKSLVELMYKEAINTERTEANIRIRETLLNRLLLFSNESDYKELNEIEKILGYDFSLERRVLVFELDNCDESLVLQGVYHDDNRFKLERTQRDIIKNVMGLLKEEDIITKMDWNKMVIIKTFNGKSNNNIIKFINMIQQQIKIHTKHGSIVGIGSLTDNIKGINKSYKDALVSVKIGKKIFNSSGIYNQEELPLESLIHNIPEDTRSKFSNQVLNDKFIRNETLLKTLISLLDNNLNVSKTAKALYVHRNTLIYRLNRIKEITNLNPQTLKDAMTLQLALIIRQYDENHLNDFS